MRPTAMLLALVALCAGCAAGTGAERWTFERSNTSEMQVKRDANDCLSQALNAASLDRPGFVRVDRELYRTCMEQRGYTVRTDTGFSNPSSSYR